MTVGYGRNLEAVPFTQDEMDLMFKNDFERARKGAESFYVYEFLNRARRGVLIEMVFQMGTAGVKNFKKFRAAALQQKWQEAHDEMLDSRWHDQTPERARELATIFLRGEE
jgi:hypothetical protein